MLAIAGCTGYERSKVSPLLDLGGVLRAFKGSSPLMIGDSFGLAETFVD